MTRLSGSERETGAKRAAEARARLQGRYVCDVHGIADEPEAEHRERFHRDDEREERDPWWSR